MMLGEEWILSCFHNPLCPPQLPHCALRAKTGLSLTSTLPIVLHFNFVQINIQCLYYMAMQMILMAKLFLFLSCTLFYFLQRFCFVLYLHLDYSISLYISLVSSEFIAISTPNSPLAVSVFSPHVRCLCSAANLIFFKNSLLEPSALLCPDGWVTRWHPGPALLPHSGNSLCLSCVGPHSSRIPLILMEHIRRQLPESDYRETRRVGPCTSDRAIVVPSHLVSGFSAYRILGWTLFSGS